VGDIWHRPRRRASGASAPLRMACRDKPREGWGRGGAGAVRAPPWCAAALAWRMEEQDLCRTLLRRAQHAAGRRHRSLRRFSRGIDPAACAYRAARTFCLCHLRREVGTRRAAGARLSANACFAHRRLARLYPCGDLTSQPCITAFARQRRMPQHLPWWEGRVSPPRVSCLCWRRHVFSWRGDMPCQAYWRGTGVYRGARITLSLASACGWLAASNARASAAPFAGGAASALVVWKALLCSCVPRAIAFKSNTRITHRHHLAGQTSSGAWRIISGGILSRKRRQLERWALCGRGGKHLFWRMLPCDTQHASFCYLICLSTHMGESGRGIHPREA